MQGSSRIPGHERANFQRSLLRGDKRRVQAGRLQPGDSAPGRAHSLSHHILREPGAGGGLEHFTCNFVFQFESRVRFSETLKNASHTAGNIDQARKVWSASARPPQGRLGKAGRIRPAEKDPRFGDEGLS